MNKKLWLLFGCLAMCAFARAGTVDHFRLSPIGSPQATNTPFSVNITARDASDALVSNFKGTVGFSASASASPLRVFAEDFEDGDFSDWTIGDDWFFKPMISTGTSAEGSNSFSIIGQSAYHYDGIWHSLPSLRPGWINFYVRTAATDKYGGYFVVADADDGASTTTNNTAVFFFFTLYGTMGIYEDVGHAHTVPYTSNRWYQISLALDWTNRTVDYYVDNVLAYSAVPFRGSQASTLRIVHLYNFNDTQSWWDGIEFINGGYSMPIAISPTNSTAFSSGSWTGNIAALQPGTNIVLSVRDSGGHGGSGNAFDVVLPNDLSVLVTRNAGTLSMGSNFSYTLSVGNTGPSTATGVVLTNFLPDKATFRSATASQGTFSQTGGILSWTIGALPSGTNATLTVVLSAIVAGTYLTNVAVVTASLPDANPDNNTAVDSPFVIGPGISVADSAILEGNAGASDLLFNVLLAAPCAQTVKVDYATSPGTAQPSSDYATTSGTLLFPPGTTNQVVRVSVFGDTVFETDETLYLNLSFPEYAWLARGQAVGTIINDDAPASISRIEWSPINPTQYVKQPFRATLIARDQMGNLATNFTGPVALSAFLAGPLETNTILGPLVHQYATGGGWTVGYAFTPNTNLTVTHVRPYFGTKVSLWTDAGQLLVAQDIADPISSWAEVPLATPVQLQAGTRYRLAAYANNYTDFDLGMPGIFPHGTIDVGYNAPGDAFPNRGDSTHWYLVDIVYSVGSPPPLAISPGMTGTFSNGIWQGAITAQAGATNVICRADDGAGHTGTSNPFDVQLWTGVARLNFLVSGRDLVLAWAGPYTLQSATNVPGPYFDVAGAVSPFTIDVRLSDSKRFFRLRN